MKQKELQIVYNDQYGFIVDKEAEIKEGDLCLANGETYNNTIVKYIKSPCPPPFVSNLNILKKILAYIKLSHESPNIEGLIEVKLIDVENISEKSNGYAYYGKPLGEKYLTFKEGFIEGYNHNRQIFPQPTWEDVENAFKKGWALGGDLNFGKSPNIYITQLKQSKLPKSFILGDGETISEKIKNGVLK